MNTSTCRLLIVCIFGSLLISGCSTEKALNTPETSSPKNQVKILDKNKEQPSSPKSTEPESQVLVDNTTKESREITTTNFKPQVSVNLEQYKESFFNDEIINMLNSTLEAVIDQDKEKFNKYIHQGNSLDSLFFSEEKNKYMFYDVEFIQKLIIDDRVRINVLIRYAEKSSDNVISNTNIMFTFTKNKEGQWGIANID